MRARWVARTLRNDLPLMVGGMAAFWRHARRQDDVDVSLSLFSTPTREVASGRACTYEVAVANVAAHSLCRILTIEAHAQDVVPPQRGDYASFSKRLILAPRRSSRIAVVFDWRSDARFGIDGVWLRPDLFTAGVHTAPGRYVVRAALRDRTGAVREALTVLQQLQS